jgi:hypothetical protein
LNDFFFLAYSRLDLDKIQLNPNIRFRQLALAKERPLLISHLFIEEDKMPLQAKLIKAPLQLNNYNNFLYCDSPERHTIAIEYILAIVSIRTRYSLFVSLIELPQKIVLGCLY